MVIHRDGKSFGSQREMPKISSDVWNRESFWSAFRHFETHFAEKLRMSIYSWMMDPNLSLEIPSFSATDLDEIRRSSKISLWIWSITSGVVTFLGRPLRGATQMENLPLLNWVTQFLTMGDTGAFPLMFLSQWREFPSAPCLFEKTKSMTALVSMFLKSL